MSRCVFNLHVPPYDSTLDTAAELDEDFKMVLIGKEPHMIPVGSTAVREAIEKYQPLASLHGHIHESPGAKRIGRTLCINPGSDYHTGRIAGCLVTLRGDQGDPPVRDGVAASAVGDDRDLQQHAEPLQVVCVVAVHGGEVLGLHVVEDRPHVAVGDEAEAGQRPGNAHLLPRRRLDALAGDDVHAVAVAVSASARQASVSRPVCMREQWATPTGSPVATLLTGFTRGRPSTQSSGTNPSTPSRIQSGWCS